MHTKPHTHTQEMNYPYLSTSPADVTGDKDKDNPVLLSAVQLREDTTLSPISEDSPTKKRQLFSSSGSHHNEADRDSVSSNDNCEVDQFEIEEATPRARRPLKSILRPSNHPIRVSTIYVSAVNAPDPFSPRNNSNSTAREQHKCSVCCYCALL